MRPFEVSECCCGCDLRPGSVAILWTYMIIDVIILLPLLAFVGVNSPYSGIFIFELVSIVVALFGIQQKKNLFMIPYLSCSAIGVGISFLVFLATCFTAVDIIEKINQGVPQHDLQKLWFAPTLISFMYFAFKSHFTMVLYSYFKVLRRKDEPLRALLVTSDDYLIHKKVAPIF